VSVRFCPKCGGLMRPAKIKGKLYLVCTRCGYREELSDPKVLEAYRLRVKVSKSPRDKLVVVEGGSKPAGASLLKGSVRCPKCGHDEVYVWMVQTRSADEPPTRFYRCAKCGYTWREYA